MTRWSRGIPALAAVAFAVLLSGGGCRATPAQPGSSPQGRTPLRFQDVAAEAGLEWTPDRTLRPPLDILQTAGFGGGFLDYDGDGWQDIILAGSPTCALFRNERNGRFRDVTARAGLQRRGFWMGCASADYDNDGRADLLLTGYRALALYHNDGGTFSPVALPFPTDLWASSAAFLDYDRDGWLDLYVGCYVRFGPKTRRLCDFLGVKAACPPSEYDAQVGRLYRNLAGKGWKDVTRAAGLDAAHGKTLGVAAADVDGDGWTDLYLANDGMPGDLFLNARGRFRNAGLESGTAFNFEGREQAGMGVDWGDVDADQRPDLVVTTFQHEPTSLYLNQGAGAFREAAFAWGLGDPTVSRLGFGAKFLDAANSGELDLVLANGHVQDAIDRMQPGVTFRQPLQLFRAGTGGFQECADWGPAEARRPVVGRGVALADYDRDGRMDVLVTTLEGPPLLLHNQTSPAGNWVALRLESSQGPRDGSGTAVSLRIGARTLARWPTTGGGYLSCSQPELHVGLGSARQVDAIEVTWPGGRRQTWREVPANRAWLLVEGRDRLEELRRP